MLAFDNAIAQILRDTKDVMEQNEFSVVRPDGLSKDELPVRQSEDHKYMDFSGKKGTIRLEFFGNQSILYFSNVAPEEATEEDFKKVSMNYFDLESFEEKDVKSFCNEVNDAVQEKFGSHQEAKSKRIKTPAPISRSAVRNGNQSYDANTLANRLLGMYPELKEPYRENFETYGDFMAEDFFMNHATPIIMETIRSGSTKECNKLFRILNDIYESGLNDTQSLIAVSILGEMKNDAKMLETAKEYMCDDMRDLVILVNKRLYSSAGKKDLEKLKNPPPYKPKKEKKPGMFSQMMGAGGDMMPPVN